MPIGEENVRHLLRRTEFVDATSRVNALKDLTREQAVDNIIGTASGSAGQLGIGSGEVWQQGQGTIKSWLDRMAGRSGGSPFRERMAFFWHGHLCSELGKVNSGPFMREQIDLFRSDGVNGTVGQLLKDMAVQVAMLRYLDGDRNIATSPNQNFARELMELFVLGVGNYTEADVEAATDAWTGFTAAWNAPGGNSGEAVDFRFELHSVGPRQFYGRTINQVQYRFAGFETIDVLLWLDTVYVAAEGGSTNYSALGGKVPVGPNAGRNTKEVAAEFLSKKLWQEFGEANTAGPSFAAGRVGKAMVDALLGSNFQIKPWVRAMLVHDDFYAASTKQGLVRQPTEYMVALMVATGRSAGEIGQTWLMDNAGQVPLYPPNVSGWKPNGYWVNASAMEARNRMAQSVKWKLLETYWESDVINFAGNKTITKSDVQSLSPTALVDRVLLYLDLGPVGPGRSITAETRQSLIAFCSGVEWWKRSEVLLLALLAPEMHVA